MTIQQQNNYKRSATVGDRLKCEHYTTIWYVTEVQERGVVVSLSATGSDHEHLMDWDWLYKYDIVHKEPHHATST